MSATRHRLGSDLRAFTLMEVLIGILILGVGLVMVAAIFPVAANWTRQSEEETVALQVAESARSQILLRLSASDLTTITTSLAPLPVKGIMPLYAGSNVMAPGDFLFPQPQTIANFGATGTFNVGDLVITGSSSGTSIYRCAAPVTLTSGANVAATYTSSPFVPQGTSAPTLLYSWQALIRKNPAAPSTSNTYDLYIFVCKKGSPAHWFPTTTQFVDPILGGYTATEGITDTALGGYWVTTTSLAPYPNIFKLQLTTTSTAAANVNGYFTYWPQNALGLNAVNGSVFRNLGTAASDGGSGGPATALNANTDAVYCVPPALGTTVSPLVLIYQTTVQF